MSHISNKHMLSILCTDCLWYPKQNRNKLGRINSYLYVPWFYFYLNDKLINQVSTMVTTSQHKLQLKDFKQQPFEVKLLIFDEILSWLTTDHRSDKPWLELVGERPSPRVETLIQVVARQVGYPAHVKVRKPRRQE